MEWSLKVVTPGGAAVPSSLEHLDEPQLVALAAAGRREAFDLIVVRHRRSVYQVCYRFAHNHEDASDMAQETFVRAWRGLGQFRGQSALSTWLYRIAVNVCLNKASLKAVPTEALGDGDRLEDTRAERPGAELQRSERARAVRRAIQSLPRKQRATLVLRMYHELSHQQIADILGSSVGAVKANFFHALGNLKRILGSEP
jgi:RNA polymerase sigma-70 factor (ECF subfamily)